VQFVLAAPNRSRSTGAVNRTYTKRLLRLKQEVIASIGEGKVSQLPKLLREKLIMSGSDMYSLDTGLAKGVITPDSLHEETAFRWGIPSFEKLPKGEMNEKLHETRRVQKLAKEYRKLLRSNWKLGTNRKKLTEAEAAAMQERVTDHYVNMRRRRDTIKLDD